MGLGIQYQRGKPILKRQALSVFFGLCQEGQQKIPHARVKFVDAHDFIRMVKSNPNIDLDKLAELGDMVYPEGGKEVVEMVRQVRAGEKLRL